MEPINLCSLARQFQDEGAAWELVEKMRWADGEPVCPHCGEVGNASRLAQRRTSTGKVSYRRLWKCKGCKKQFSCLVGTIFQGSQVPLSKWLMAVFMLVSDKNGIAAWELHRTLGVTHKTAWFMLQRIRKATEVGPLAELMKGTVVADETYIGGNPRNRHGWNGGTKGRQGDHDKTAVLTMIVKETGEVRSEVLPFVSGARFAKALTDNVDVSASELQTDQHKGYILVGKRFVSHRSVDHSRYEFARGNVSTNRAEGFFGQLKPSIKGTHHYVSPKHLHRYVSEFGFRYTTCKMSDSERMWTLMGQTGGRRLTYAELTEKPKINMWGNPVGSGQLERS